MRRFYAVIAPMGDELPAQLVTSTHISGVFRRLSRIVYGLDSSILTSFGEKRYFDDVREEGYCNIRNFRIGIKRGEGDYVIARRYPQKIDRVIVTKQFPTWKTIHISKGYYVSTRESTKYDIFDIGVLELTSDE